MMRAWLVTIVFLTATKASAWTISTAYDPVTDELINSASVSTVGASLVVACRNGQPEPRLRLDQNLVATEIVVSYRFDDGPITPRMAAISPDGQYLWPWRADASAAIWKLRRGKRFRLSVGDASFDFDLTTSDQLPVILC
jgi:hypothetical protein